MSRLGRILNDAHDPDRHLWPAEDFAAELSELLVALEPWDTGRWNYAPVSDGKGICLTGKDGDLEASGHQGIELVSADEDGVTFRVRAGATFVGNDVCLNLRPRDEQNEQVFYAYREAYLAQAQEVICGIPFPGFWTGDDWYIHHESELLRAEWEVFSHDGNEIEFDYGGTAARIVAVAEHNLKDWEREIGIAHEILDVIAGWRDDQDERVPPKTDDDPALPLLRLDANGDPIVWRDDEPGDGFRDDVEADADVLRSAGLGTDEDYGSAENYWS